MSSYDGLILQVDAPKAVVDEFREGLHVQMGLAQVRQKRINEDCRKMKARLVPGLGQCIASVDPDIYFAMMHRFGRDCWKDKDFLKSCIKHGTVVKPRVETRKCTIIMP